MRFNQPRAINPLSYLAAALFFITILATQTPAQTGGSRPSPIDRRVEQMQRQREQNERDTLRDKADVRDQRSAGQRTYQAIIVQVKQDFERIQTVYNEIVLALSANNALDYKFISEATGEVRKCAGRLKKNLALPEPVSSEPDTKRVNDIQEDMIKPTLQKLCRHIFSFVTNPLFETSGLLDIEQATKASKDLSKIFELSEEIDKSVNRLSGTKK